MTAFGIIAACIVTAIFAAIIAGVWLMAGQAVEQGDDPTGTENLAE